MLAKFLLNIYTKGASATALLCVKLKGFMPRFVCMKAKKYFHINYFSRWRNRISICHTWMIYNVKLFCWWAVTLWSLVYTVLFFHSIISYILANVIDIRFLLRRGQFSIWSLACVSVMTLHFHTNKLLIYRETTCRDGLNIDYCLKVNMSMPMIEICHPAKLKYF